MRDLKEQLQCYETLIEVARSLTRALDLEAVVQEILAHSQNVMKAEACSLYLYDEDTEELVIHSARGETAPMLNAFRIPKEVGIAGTVFTSKEVVNVQDAQNDPRHNKAVDKKTGFVTRSMLTVPLIQGKECHGVLQLINSIDRAYFGDQDEMMCEVFASLIVSALLRLNAQEQAVAKAKSAKELELAREIQQSFLPESFQDYNYAKVHMHYLPASEVGGDFCLVIPLDKNRLLLCLGDVTGKGIPASLTMSRVTAKIQTLSKRLALSISLQANLGAWVTELNEEIASDLTNGRFIGATFLLADSRNCTIQVCAAGQYGPVCGHHNEWTFPHCTNQIPLGVLPGFEYEGQTHRLRPGQQWFLYSDGITEARNLEDEEYSEKSFVKSLPKGNASEMTMKAAVQGWEDFTQGAAQHDDASILLLDWRGNPPAPLYYEDCKPSHLSKCRDFVESWAHYAGFDDLTVGHIVLACDEAVTNIYRYAYDGKSGPIKYTMALEDGMLIIHIQDEGKPVELDKLKGRELEDIRPGGLGMVLIHKVFDEVIYEPKNVGTLLTLKKKITKDIPEVGDAGDSNG